MLIFGGVTPLGEYNTAVIQMDCETMNFEVIRTKNSLQLQGFVIFSIEDRIFFWGGSEPHSQDIRFSQCQNKLIVFENE